jgi:hypothetical protein
VLKTDKNKSINLDHLYRLTDNVGILEHCIMATPDLREGYCVDDNARALQIAIRLREEKLVDIYLKFLVSAVGEKGIKNDLSRELVWQNEELGENFGRAMAGLADAGKFGLREDHKLTGMFIFDQCIKYIKDVETIRVKAWLVYGLLTRALCDPRLELKIENYCKVRTSQKKIEPVVKLDYKGMAKKLADQLIVVYCDISNNSWKWFEDRITYDNGRLPLALFWAYSIFDDIKYADVAKESLDFLLKQMYNRDLKCFSFPGYKGWFERNGKKSIFGQQPIEAGSIAEACEKAYLITRENKYLKAIEDAYGWFYGNNVLGKTLVDNESGGVYDGLEKEGVNLNQGAESVLSFLTTYLSAKNLGFIDKV